MRALFSWKNIAVAIALGVTLRGTANPGDMTVAAGSATTEQSGSLLTVNVGSPVAFLNWGSFNIGAGETTVFNQLSSDSYVINNIGDANASQIYGSLQANGNVVLINPNGFYFGPNSFVKVGGSFIASTAQMAPPQNSGGGWEFNGPPPLAGIINYGQIQVGAGRSAFLIAENIENHGMILAPGGSIGLAAGQTVLLSDRPDGRGMSMEVTLPDGSIDNSGKLIADAGTISLNARVVNQNGLLQADSVQDQNGVIELIAADQIHLGANSQIVADGDATAVSSGGSVTLRSGNVFSDNAGSTITARGGGQGGDGGVIEICAPTVHSLHTQMDATAKAGWTSGKLFLDPDNIVLDLGGPDSINGDGTLLAGDSPGSTLYLNVYGAFFGFSEIHLQANNNIILADGTFWSLPDATGSGDGHLVLEAGHDIVFGDQAAIYDYGNWSVTLRAGVNNFSSGSVQSGVGNIYLNGGAGLNLNGSILVNSGSINLLAGDSILVGSGSVATSGGGSITATAVGGSVNTGTDPAGYTYNLGSSRSDILYQVDASFPASLGGISTGAGGDVTITAGKDIISFMPSGTLNSDAGSGAFGGGNVTLTAGRDIEGHFVLANGTGVISAGHDAGVASHELALSLVAGGWTVNAGHNILLQEVRNPNGIFNNFGFGGSTTVHYFDYAPDDYVTLNAGNAVTLSGSGLPRNSGSFEQGIPSIYPSILTINAGAGGVVLGGPVILFPSPQGALNITTTGHGPFETAAYAAYLLALNAYDPLGGDPLPLPPGDQVPLIMSDSGSAQYLSAASFGVADHAAVPVHLNHPTSVALNIGGDMDNISLAVPEAAQINIGGNMLNSRFAGQNLHSSDVTSINVAGDILNRNEFTSITVATTPNLGFLNEGLPSPFTDLFSRLHYDPATHTLTVQGRLTSADLAALTSLEVQVVDAEGTPLTDALGNPITQIVSILGSSTALALFNATQDVPINPGTGYVLGGGGQFNFTAHNLDLGATLGIQSVGPAANSSLANYFTRGVDIHVDLSGNLDMFSTTISSLNGGSITIDAAGHANIGSTVFTGNDDFARGIFTVANSPISLVAGGDINVNGSRIATYDGGDIFVESLNGNVDAGRGGHGSVSVEEIYVDPITRAIETYTPRISGSGILAITFPDAPGASIFPHSQNTVGNILVETPQGNINASAGGVVQISLNNINLEQAWVTLLAGKDANGNVISPGRDINASGSGVIGTNVRLDASGNIIGLIFARNSLNLSADQNVTVTALAGGSATVSAGDTVSGTIIAAGGIDASGSSVDASLLSEGSINTSGDSSGAQKGFAQGTAGDAASQAASNDSTAKADDTGPKPDDDKDKKDKTIALARRTGRVTVVLPPKNLTEIRKSDNPL